MKNIKFKNLFTVLAVLITLLAPVNAHAWTDAGEAKNQFSGTVGPGGFSAALGGSTFDGEDNEYDVQLHDDFDTETRPEAGVEKSVYAENYGDTPVKVRIRLSEYMRIGTDSIIPGAVENDVTTWTPHVLFDKYDPTNNHPVFHLYWDFTMGGEKFYMPREHLAQDNFIEGGAASDTTVYNGAEAFVKQTINATVMTMAAWVEAGSAEGPIWVVDQDGWAYWAQPLMPGEATGLLLSGVRLSAAPDDDYYYAIYVEMQVEAASEPPQLSQLTISKTVANADGSALTNAQKELPFELIVSFSDDGEYPYIFENNTYTLKSGGSIELRHSQSVEFENLPVGLNYDIIETPVEGYSTTSENRKGTILTEAAHASFTNTLVAKATQDTQLTVRKQVTGIVTDKAFNFTLSVGGEKIPFSLRDGETKTFTLAAGESYAVDEDDYSAEGFALASIINGHGTATGEAIAAVVTNRYTRENPTTGEGVDVWTWMPLALASATVLVLLLKKLRSARR